MRVCIVEDGTKRRRCTASRTGAPGRWSARAATLIPTRSPAWRTSPLDDVVHAHLAANAGDVLAGALVVHRGGARDHGELLWRQAGERGDDLVRHRVAEVSCAGSPERFASGRTSSRGLRSGPRSGFRSRRDAPDEAIAAPRQRFDEPGPIGRIAQRLAQPADRRVQAVLEVDEDLVAPQPPTQRVPRDDFAGPLEQRREHLERLFAQVDANAALAQLPQRQIDFEAFEAHDSRHRGRFRESVGRPDYIPRAHCRQSVGIQRHARQGRSRRRSMRRPLSRRRRAARSCPARVSASTPGDCIR